MNCLQVVVLACFIASRTSWLVAAFTSNMDLSKKSSKYWSSMYVIAVVTVGVPPVTTGVGPVGVAPVAAPV